MGALIRRRWLWITVVATAAVLAIAVPVALAFGPPTLNGENLNTNTLPSSGPSGTITVDHAIPTIGSCTGLTFDFHVTGVSSGDSYYSAGTFAADGSFTFGDPIFTLIPPQQYAVTGFTETFTIVPSTGTDHPTGTKTLVPATPSSPNFGECGVGPLGRQVGVHSVNTTYTATLNGSVAECGNSNLELDYDPDTPSGGGNGGFNELLLAGTCPAPPTDPAISAQGGYTFSGTEPASVSGTVATFTDPDPTSMPGEYSASIDWGDGMSSAGTISGPTGGPFSVNGSHTYADEGSYTITVTITDTDNAGNTATATDGAKIDDAALHASGLPQLASPPSYTGPVATFTDDNSTSTTADFSATINWGDSTSSAGTVTGSGTSGYQVNGSHTYTATGSYTIKTHIVDDGGSTTDASTKIVVFGFAPGGGSFAIGDKNSAVGTSVTFWGAQWWKLNSLSGGAAPASFKGFALHPSTPSCGVGWSTDPGNSAPPPPAPLPAYMAVTVTSSAGKSGSQISGNTVHVVVVKTNPGYESNPGHAGTGTVVAQIC